MRKPKPKGPKIPTRASFIKQYAQPPKNDLLDFAKKYRRELINGKQERRDENTKQTKPERIVAKILKDNGIDFVTEFEIFGKYYDFRAEYRGVSCLIESHGCYWHGDPRQYTQTQLSIMQIKNRVNDLIKEAYAKSQGLPLIVMWEDELECADAEDVLLNRLRKATEPKIL